MGKLKGIFMGTPETAIPALVEFNNLVDLKLVVTRKDKPKGRKRVLTPPPVKVKAAELNIPVVQPEKIKNNEDFLNTLKEINPDVILVVAWGKVLPETI